MADSVLGFDYLIFVAWFWKNASNISRAQSFFTYPSGLTAPLRGKLFYRIQIHDPVARGSAPPL
jgi:hypothetical protein